MLREIGLGTLLLIILTLVVGGAALTTADFGPFAASSIGVTSETALSWGQNADLVMDEEAEAAHEAENGSEETEATEEANE